MDILATLCAKTASLPEDDFIPKNTDNGKQTVNSVVEEAPARKKRKLDKFQNDNDTQNISADGDNVQDQVSLKNKDELLKFQQERMREILKKAQEESKTFTSKSEKRRVAFQKITKDDAALDIQTTKKATKKKNVLEKMESSGYQEGPYKVLYDCVNKGYKAKVYIRRYKGMRGILTGYIVAFDLHMNMAMIDIEEIYSIETWMIGEPLKKRRERKKKEIAIEGSMDQQNTSSEAVIIATSKLPIDITPHLIKYEEIKEKNSSSTTNFLKKLTEKYKSTSLIQSNIPSISSSKNNNTAKQSEPGIDNVSTTIQKPSMDLYKQKINDLFVSALQESRQNMQAQQNNQHAALIQRSNMHQSIQTAHPIPMNAVQPTYLPHQSYLQNNIASSYHQPTVAQTQLLLNMCNAFSSRPLQTIQQINTNYTINSFNPIINNVPPNINSHSKVCQGEQPPPPPPPLQPMENIASPFVENPPISQLKTNVKDPRLQRKKDSIKTNNTTVDPSTVNVKIEEENTVDEIIKHPSKVKAKEKILKGADTLVESSTGSITGSDKKHKKTSRKPKSSKKSKVTKLLSSEEVVDSDIDVRFENDEVLPFSNTINTLESQHASLQLKSPTLANSKSLADHTESIDHLAKADAVKQEECVYNPSTVHSSTVLKTTSKPVTLKTEEGKRKESQQLETTSPSFIFNNFSFPISRQISTSSTLPTTSTTLNAITTSSIMATPTTITMPSIMTTPNTIATSSLMTTPNAVTTSSIMTAPTSITTSSIMTTPNAMITSSIITTPTTITASSIMTTPTTITTLSIMTAPNAMSTSSIMTTPTTITTSSNVITSTLHSPIFHTTTTSPRTIYSATNDTSKKAQSPKVDHETIATVNSIEHIIKVGDKVLGEDLCIREDLCIQSGTPEIDTDINLYDDVIFDDNTKGNTFDTANGEDFGPDTTSSDKKISSDENNFEQFKKSRSVARRQRIFKTSKKVCSFTYHAIAKQIDKVKHCRMLPRIERKIVKETSIKMTPLFEDAMIRGESSTSEDDIVKKKEKKVKKKKRKKEKKKRSESKSSEVRNVKVEVGSIRKQSKDKSNTLKPLGAINPITDKNNTLKQCDQSGLLSREILEANVRAKRTEHFATLSYDKLKALRQHVNINKVKLTNPILKKKLIHKRPSVPLSYKRHDNDYDQLNNSDRCNSANRKRDDKLEKRKTVESIYRKKSKVSGSDIVNISKSKSNTPRSEIPKSLKSEEIAIKATPWIEDRASKQHDSKQDKTVKQNTLCENTKSIKDKNKNQDEILDTLPTLRPIRRPIPKIKQAKRPLDTRPTLVPTIVNDSATQIEVESACIQKCKSQKSKLSVARMFKSDRAKNNDSLEIDSDWETELVQIPQISVNNENKPACVNQPLVGFSFSQLLNIEVQQSVNQTFCEEKPCCSKSLTEAERFETVVGDIKDYDNSTVDNNKISFDAITQLPKSHCKVKTTPPKIKSLQDRLSAMLPKDSSVLKTNITEDDLVNVNIALDDNGLNNENDISIEDILLSEQLEVQFGLNEANHLQRQNIGFDLVESDKPMNPISHHAIQASVITHNIESNVANAEESCAGNAIEVGAVIKSEENSKLVNENPEKVEVNTLVKDNSCTIPPNSSYTVVTNSMQQKEDFLHSLDLQRGQANVSRIRSENNSLNKESESQVHSFTGHYNDDIEVDQRQTNRKAIQNCNVNKKDDNENKNETSASKTIYDKCTTEDVGMLQSVDEHTTKDHHFQSTVDGRTSKDVDMLQSVDKHAMKDDRFESTVADHTSKDNDILPSVDKHTMKYDHFESTVAERTSEDVDMLQSKDKHTSKDDHFESTVNERTSKDVEMLTSVDKPTTQDYHLESTVNERTSKDVGILPSVDKPTTKDDHLESTVDNPTSEDVDILRSVDKHTTKDDGKLQAVDKPMKETVIDKCTTEDDDILPSVDKRASKVVSILPSVGKPLQDDDIEEGELTSSDDENITCQEKDIERLKPISRRLGKRSEHKESKSDVIQMKPLKDGDVFDLSETNVGRLKLMKEEGEISDSSGTDNGSMTLKRDRKSKDKEKRHKDSRRNEGSHHRHDKERRGERTRRKDELSENDRGKRRHRSDSKYSREQERNVRKGESKERSREHDKERSREHDKERNRGNDKERNREHDKERNREYGKENRDHAKEKERRRHKDTETERKHDSGDKKHKNRRRSDSRDTSKVDNSKESRILGNPKDIEKNEDEQGRDRRRQIPLGSSSESEEEKEKELKNSNMNIFQQRLSTQSRKRMVDGTVITAKQYGRDASARELEKRKSRHQLVFEQRDDKESFLSRRKRENERVRKEKLESKQGHTFATWMKSIESVTIEDYTKPERGKIFKKRYVNQLFIRGDNIVMVAYHDQPHGE